MLDYSTRIISIIYCIDDEHARALEEQWIDSLDNGSTASLSQSGDTGNSNMLQGILVGFFFPVLPFFFMRSQKPATFWDDGSEPEPPANVIFSYVDESLSLFS